MKDIGTTICCAVNEHKQRFDCPPEVIVLGVKQKKAFLDSGLDGDSLGGVSIHWSDKWNEVSTR